MSDAKLPNRTSDTMAHHHSNYHSRKPCVAAYLLVQFCCILLDGVVAILSCQLPIVLAREGELELDFIGRDRVQEHLDLGSIC
eukprot:scaffold8125_cov592-Prasinococcus_capsulatus_cf.AAC.1